MCNPHRALPLLAGLAAALLPAPAFANDSEAEWALGGLVLKQNDAISMDREDLFISATEVKVDYTYTNHSDAEQTVLVSFPLPALPGGDYVEPGAYPDFTTLDFTTTIDGKAVGWTRSQRAVADGRDVTAAVEAAGFPLEWYQDENAVEAISNLPAGEAARLERAGLLRHEKDWGGNDMRPNWQVETSIVREQLFPAHATVHVSHRYTPSTGGSVGGLIEHLGEKDHAAQAAAYRQRYCTDAAFFAGFRKRRQAEAARHGGADYPTYGETWIGYVLSSGANWRGPIGEFRLVVDKGLPENLVSFCMDGVTKLSPTQFEVRKTNYEPDHDLNILILQWSSEDT